ncbi:3'(2'), 5'-bisphosphate nucleotidase [Bacillus pakistanensis]|uniref:3'(2'),5'-bisphosphate nucleotidase CysQ n=1 Tax=Rossellomorea pakistanensis TaxID=992288 RepID=A0ABS2NGJ6_9BACI|nr:3'(2'),5'-bisphosphate nucleotidase CysQ [Bacillus pakistanensis]MBM7586938.1 3'(2'), 5'-bisphosphate nucleotidase [Bacillus pakistanensis]
MIENMISIALQAGKEVLDVYQSPIEVEHKTDHSPLTLADQKSHTLITEKLKRLTPHYPILSEEGHHIPFNERVNWKTFWLIDPLDGTKEFIKRNGEFTINIALINNNTSVLGVVYAPALDLLYFAEKQKGAFKLTDPHKTKNFMNESVKLPIYTQKKTTAIISRSHITENTKEFINSLQKNEGEIELISVGSSLKFCYVAEGMAHFYPRLAPTMEWDTAAGQIIVEEAGGHVMNDESQRPLLYNKECLRNPSFICKRK